MLITALAWVRASVTLAAILTTILLPSALLTMRRWPSFAAMTLAMLAMMWRGEAWKWAALDLKARASQLPPQCLQLLPKTAFSGRGSELLYDERRFAGMSFSPKSGQTTEQYEPRQRETSLARHEGQNSRPENRRALPATFHPTFYPALFCPVLCPHTPSRTSPEGLPQDDLINLAQNYHINRHPTASTFHMTYIV